MITMGGAKGAMSTLEGKKTRVKAVSSQLASSQIVFGAKSSGLSVPQMAALRELMPTGTKVEVVKNKLMKVASQEAASGEGWAAIDPLLKSTKMWFFVDADEGDLKGTLKGYKEFLKETIDNKDIAKEYAVRPPDLVVTNLPNQ